MRKTRTEPTAREKEVMELVGTVTDSEIARRLAISREGVRKIKARLGLCKVMGPRPVRRCPKCGQPMPGSKARMCPTCRIKAELNSFYLVTCAYCGRIFPMPAHAYNASLARGYRAHYCSRSCYGKHARKHLRPRKRQLNYEDTGTGPPRAEWWGDSRHLAA